MRHWVTGAAALILLAGCGGEPEEMSADQVADELSSVRIEPGQWEATNEIIEASAPGLPPEALKQMIGRKTTVSNCVTEEQAEKPDANFLAAQQNANCKYEDFSMRGGRMNGRMVCSGGDSPGQMEMTMDGEYGARSYDMTMDMAMMGMPAGADMKMKARTTGRRIGDCPKS